MEYKSSSEFNELIGKLQVMVSGDEQSIVNQLLTLSDNHLVYQMINFCRGFEVSSSKNFEIGNFIDQSYASFQVIGIRGLSDDAQANSLSLINAFYLLKKQREHLTRQNYVCHGGQQYFWEEERKRFIEEQQKKDRIEVVKAGPWAATMRRHEEFDKLAFTDSVGDRKPDELVDDRIFQNLFGELKECHDIGKFYANTMVTHRQNKEGRRVLTDRDIKLTIDGISRCHKFLWAVFNTISSFFLQSSYSSTISKIQDRNAYLNEAWIRPEDQEKYSAELDRISEEMEKELNCLIDFL